MTIASRILKRYCSVQLEGQVQITPVIFLITLENVGVFMPTALAIKAGVVLV